MSDTGTRLPTYFISHGGGPWPWIKDQMPWDMSTLERSLQAMPREVGVTPKAVLVISGHWEEREFTVQSSANPPMVYDYGGFPEFTYHITYPAPGSPEVAARVAELLSGAGIAVTEDPRRGFDHGTFAPLVVMYPDADVPVVQLSLKRGYDPEAHLAAGRALAPLRDEGVLIVGSGMSFHNLRSRGRMPGVPVAGTEEFDHWLTAAVESEPARRDDLLTHWAQAPSARIAHPREEHLLPLMVVAGAAGEDPGARTFNDLAMGWRISGYRFGAPANAA